MKTLCLKNYFLLPIPENKERKIEAMESLQDWLILQPAVGAVSRFKGRFVRDLAPQIQDRLKEIQDAHKELVEKFAAKDAEGNKVFVDEKEEDTKEDTGRVKLSDVKAFQEEYVKLLNEDFVVDITPKNEAEFEAAKGVLLNTTVQFGGIGEARYNEWCEAFEKAGPVEEPKPEVPSNA